MNSRSDRTTARTVFDMTLGAAVGIAAFCWVTHDHRETRVMDLIDRPGCKNVGYVAEQGVDRVLAVYRCDENIKYWGVLP